MDRTPALPTCQTALWVEKPGQVVIREDAPLPEPQPNQVVVKIQFSGLCHSDVYNISGAHPMSTHVPGHEGIGVIVRLGENVGHTRGLGQRVGVKWINETCGRCDICLRDETACPHQHNSGRDVPGTLQEYVTVSVDHASPIPDSLSGVAATPLLCAGLTVYAALKKSNTQNGDTIVITGAGGGLGHIAIQIAARKGLKVIGIDSASKELFCREQGAQHFFAFDDANLEESLRAVAGYGGAHAALCCAGSGQSYSQALRLLRRGGTLVCVGLPATGSYTIPATPFDMVVNGLQIVGSSVGTESELQELLSLAAAGDVRPCTHLLPLRRYQEAIDAVQTSSVQGRIVLQME